MKSGIVINHVLRFCIILIIFLLTACDDSVTRSNPTLSKKSLEIFAGSASQPPTEELVKRFEAETGIKCTVHFGGSGEMLGQMIVTSRGDIYFPGSSDYMELAIQKGVVLAGTAKIAAYLVPAIIVPKNNPAKIYSLNDLAKPDIQIGIARPDSVCVGLYGVEILEKNGLTSKVKPKIKTYTTSCAQTVQIVSLGLVDAVLGWRVFQYWDEDNLQAITLQPNEVARLGYIPIAISTYTQYPEAANKFMDYITGETGKAVFANWNYITTEAEARKYATESTPIGGQWDLPDIWKN